MQLSRPVNPNVIIHPTMLGSLGLVAGCYELHVIKKAKTEAQEAQDRKQQAITDKKEGDGAFSQRLQREQTSVYFSLFLSLRLAHH